MDEEDPIRISLSAMPGDQILAKVKNALIVNVYEDTPDQIVAIEIICHCDEGYLAYIPADLYLKNSFVVTKQNCQEYGIPKQFVGGSVHYLTDQHIYSIRQRIDGLVCRECQEFAHLAEANQEDGGFVCWKCRSYPHYD